MGGQVAKVSEGRGKVAEEAGQKQQGNDIEEGGRG